MLANIVEECIFRTGTKIFDGLRIHNHGLRATSITHQKQEHMTDREVMTASRQKCPASVAHYDRSGQYDEVWDKRSAMFTAVPQDHGQEKTNKPETEKSTTPVKRKFGGLMEDDDPEKEEGSAVTPKSKIPHLSGQFEHCTINFNVSYHSPSQKDS
jgi:hypothetical protein